MKTKMPEILSFISEEAISRKMTSEEIAVHFGYDKHHFSRKFKEMNGFSVAEFLSTLKVEKAIFELDEEKRILDLQERSGFESSGSFTNTLKKYTGSSPRAYKTEKEKINVSENVLRLEVEDLDTEFEGLKTLGVIVDEAIEDVPGIIRYVDFSDPDGNKLSFYWLYDQE